MQRRILLRQFKVGQWFFSKVLDVMAGYGERPGRALFTYLLVITGFAAVYFGITNYVTPQNGSLVWYDALILSVTSFHGRGLIPSAVSLADPLSAVAAAEAILGFLIELIFIATFSRRFLGGD